MGREFNVGDVVRLKSDIDRNCLMTIFQVGANFCYCLKASQFGVSMVVDTQTEPIAFPFETLVLV